MTSKNHPAPDLEGCPFHVSDRVKLKDVGDWAGVGSIMAVQQFDTGWKAWIHIAAYGSNHVADCNRLTLVERAAAPTTPSRPDLDEMEKVALRATEGPWTGDRADGTVKYDVLAPGLVKPLVVIHGDNGNACDDDNGCYGILSAADERFILTFDPPAVLSLIAEVRRLAWSYADAMEKWNQDVQEFAPRAKEAEAQVTALTERLERAEERLAKEIYNGWKAMPGWVPWVERGNSDRQDMARLQARSQIAPKTEGGEGND